MNMLTDFYEKDEDGQDVVIPRPEAKTTSDLERVIALGKPTAVIEAFADMVATGEQWAWFDLYQEYLKDTDAYADTLSNHEPELDEEGEEIPWFPVEPVEPLRTPVRTGEQVLAPYYAARRAVLYPKLTDFADAFVKAQGGDTVELEEYVAACLQVKEDIPKSS